MIVFAWIVAGVILFSIGLGYYGSTQITVVPHLAVPYTPRDFALPYEDVVFRSEDGVRLTGWFVPAKTPSSITILIQHGVGSNHGDMLLNTMCLYQPGLWNLFYYNFRGHGDSDGHFTSLGPLELRDLNGALTYLKTVRAQGSQRLAIYGHSLGAAVALVGAAHHPELEAVAAESSFSSIPQTIRLFARMYHGIPYFPFVPLAMWFTSWRLGLRMGRFNPVDSIGKISPRPLLLIQGGRDLRIPMSDFQKLWAAAKEPKEQFFVQGADHGDPWMIDKQGYETHLTDFFRKALS